MSREYNPQGIHSAELAVSKAEKQMKRWGGKDEQRKLDEARKQLNDAHETARENERIRNQYFK